jgi:hypothetical protein
MSADRYCVMGNPVEHSRSPWIHARFGELTGQAVEYGKRLVEPGGFAEAVAAFRAEGGKGCNVTVPFKFEAAALAGLPTPRAQLAQACNTLRFDARGIFGDNTDGIGLVRDITINAATPLAGRAGWWSPTAPANALANSCRAMRRWPASTASNSPPAASRTCPAPSTSSSMALPAACTAPPSRWPPACCGRAHWCAT